MPKDSSAGYFALDRFNGLERFQMAASRLVRLYLLSLDHSRREPGSEAESFARTSFEQPMDSAYVKDEAWGRVDSARTCLCSHSGRGFRISITQDVALSTFEGEANLRRSTPRPFVTALVSLAVALIFSLSRLAGATIINSNSASQSDVAAAIASAADGDIVIIPDGTMTWTRTLPINKAITLQGAGVGSTIIKDAVQSGQLILWTLKAGYTSRLTGIEFQDGGRVNKGLAPGGILRVVGSNINGSSFRWDHCKWGDMNGFSVFDTVIGVIDHNIFYQTIDGKEYMLYAYGTFWNGKDNGDGSWAAPSNYGSSQFLFLEDNSWTATRASPLSATDGLNGCRFVVRHCTLSNTQITNHGTESGGRERGSKEMEIYNNTFTATRYSRTVAGSRAGGVLFHDNTISGFQSDTIFTLGNWRNFYPFNPWGGADGTNQWDVNKPNVFFTGAAAANSSGTTVTVSGANWTPNQWVGYTVRRTTNICRANSVTFAWIESNTYNTLTYTGNGGYTGFTSLSFCAGDTMEFRRVDHALDQCGRAGGSLITGDPPVRPAGWNNQVTEPCYCWNNTSDYQNQSVLFDAGPGVRANEHFFNNTPMPGYTPYTYPHPLTKGLPPPEQMTRNAKGNSQHNLRKERQPWGGKKLDRKKAKKAKASPTNEMVDGPENLGH
jgi:hypothetical protein